MGQIHLVDVSQDNASSKADHCQTQHDSCDDAIYQLMVVLASEYSCGLERLRRDALTGRVHSANSRSAMETAGKLAMGINPTVAPRWGK